MGVTSLPVPAVVGTNTVGTPRPGTWSMPKSDSSGQSWTSSTAATLVTSKALPPPMPSSTSAFMLASGRRTLPHGAQRRVGRHVAEYAHLEAPRREGRSITSANSGWPTTPGSLTTQTRRP